MTNEQRSQRESAPETLITAAKRTLSQFSPRFLRFGNQLWQTVYSRNSNQNPKNMDALKILESLLKNNATGSKRVEGLQKRGGGGMADILESILGGGGGARRPAGGSPPASGGSNDPRISGFEGLIGGLGSGRSKPSPPPTPPEPQAQECAAIFISAMCHAAKVDGQLDPKEKEAIIGRLGKVTQDEINFVNQELSSTLDIKSFCAGVPPQVAPQVYAFSVMAIKLDTLKEAAYLGRLAQGLDLDPDTCNRIHQQVGAPEI